MKKKIVAGIVLYNPDIKRLQENIDAVIKQVNELIIIDNYSDNMNYILKLLENYASKKVTLIKNNENLGIASALNQMMEIAKEKNYEWCLTLDQDSVIPDNTIIEYINFLQKNSNIKKNVGILCPQVKDLNKNNSVLSENSYEYIEKCITSGSLTSVSAWEYINRFDDLMFIDGVDHEFCYRLKKNNYYIIRINSVIMSHELGKIKYKRIMGINGRSMNHSSFRKYYIARNIVYVDLKHFKYIRLISYLRLCKEFILIWLIEEDRLNKTRMFLKGYRDSKNMLEKI